MNKSLFCLLTLISLYFNVYAQDECSESTYQEACCPGDDKPVKIGLFSLRASQRPEPIVGNGFNIIDEGEVQAFWYLDKYKIDSGYFIDSYWSLLYGITDRFTTFISVPVAWYKKRNNRSTGFEDSILSFEYAFYRDKRWWSIDQATVITSIWFPTGSSEKVPATGMGSPSLYLGLTYKHSTFDWIYFGSISATLTTFHGSSKTADAFSYEIGCCRTIATPPGWIFAWLLELSGTYSGRSIDRGEVSPNTGGHVLSFIPSLWISSDRIIIQFGGGTIVQQHLFGSQLQFRYELFFNWGWTF